MEKSGRSLCFTSNLHPWSLEISDVPEDKNCIKSSWQGAASIANAFDFPEITWPPNIFFPPHVLPRPAPHAQMIASNNPNWPPCFNFNLTFPPGSYLPSPIHTLNHPSAVPFALSPSARAPSCPSYAIKEKKETKKKENQRGNRNPNMSFVIRPLSSFPSRSSLLVRPTSTRAFSVTPARALSKITLVGRLAGEPELSPTSTGQEIVKYTVATNYGPKDERKTSWWRISYFPREGNNAGRDHVLSLGKGWVFFFFFF